MSLPASEATDDISTYPSLLEHPPVQFTPVVNVLTPAEWLLSLQLPDDTEIISTLSLHLDYKEATYSGSYASSAISGGTENGICSFSDGLHAWKEHEKDPILSNFAELHWHLEHNVKLLPIGRLRISALLESLKVKFDTITQPNVQHITYYSHQLETFDDFIFHIRDNQSAIPYDNDIQSIFADNTVMILILLFHHCFGYLPTFQTLSAVSSPEKLRLEKLPNRTATRRDLCFLEIGFTRLLHIAFVKYPVGMLCRWAAFETVDSADSLNIGPLNCVYLFRGKRGIEHEFVIVGFGKEGSPTSWLRAERAARAKTYGLHLQWDSLGPLFSGVPALDTVSFATNKSDLFSSKDIELAHITVKSDSKMNSLSGIFVRELCEQFAATVNDNPEYRLWSTNCRAFARRTMINVVIRLAWDPFRTVECFWGGERVNPVSILLSRLHAERFGGSALIGLPATVGRIKTLMYVANADGGDYQGALRSIDEAIEMLNGLPFDNLLCTYEVPTASSLDLLGLKCECLATKGRVLDNLGRFEESYQVSTEAIGLLPHPSTEIWENPDHLFWQSNKWRQYASAMRYRSVAALRTRRIPEGLNAACTCRQLYSPSVHYRKGALWLEQGISLGLIFAAASLTSSVEVAISVGHEAEFTIRFCYGVRPDTARIHLAEFLHNVANFHSNYSRPRLAFAASSECIDLYNAVPFIAERHRFLLVHALSDHARFAADLGKYDDSIAAEESVLHHLETLNDADPGVHENRLVRSLGLLRRRLKLAARPQKALEYTRYVERFIRQLEVSQYPKAISDHDIGIDLADACYHRGIDAAAVGNFEEATSSLHEAVDLYSARRPVTDPGRSYALIELAKCLKASGSAGAQDRSCEAVSAARLVHSDENGQDTTLLSMALSTHAYILFTSHPIDAVGAISGELESLLLRENNARDGDSDAILSCIESSAALHVFNHHESLISEGSKFMARTVDACLRAIQGNVDGLRNEVVPWLRREHTLFQASGRQIDADAYASLADMVEITLLDDDGYPGSQAPKLPASMRLQLAPESINKDDDFVTAALSTMDLEDGTMALKDGKLLSELFPRF